MAFYGRGPNKVQKPINIGAMYESYVESVDKEGPYYVEKAEYMAIITEYFKGVRDGLLAGKGSWTLPFGLGVVEILKYKVNPHSTRSMRINWKATQELGKIVYHLNEHSSGWNYRIEWHRSKNNTRNSRLYKYIPARHFKRGLASLIKSKKFDTYEF